MSITMNQWIGILKRLEADPAAVIRCPSCGKANLEYIDCPAGDKVERWIHCPSCNERSAALKAAPKPGSSS